MDELPPELVLRIMSRLNDSADQARFRVAFKTVNTLWREELAVNLICDLSQYSKSPSIAVTPFKTVFKNLIEDSSNIRSVKVGVDKAIRGISFDDLYYEDSDEFYLADTKFVQEWLPKVCEELQILSISDFWIQSCWRKSEILDLISSNCSSLVKLELTNAWLSVVGLSEMPNLRHLTLEFIRLDDENLEMVNHCFPSLRELNLIGVGGLKQPRINLLHLKFCHCTVSNALDSMAIVAPNLLELKLDCNKPKFLFLETPKLVKFNLSIEDVKCVMFSEFQDLKTLDLNVQAPDQTNVDLTVCFIKSVLENCRGLTEMRLMIHQDTDPSVRTRLISACMKSNPRLRWKWAKGSEDIYVSDVV